MSKAKYTPEAVAQATGMPVEGLRVLRELMDAAKTSDPLSVLVRAHGELGNYISVVRESYVTRASGLLNTAGAKADLQMSYPFPYSQGGWEPEKPTKTNPAGFTPNKEES